MSDVTVSNLKDVPADDPTAADGSPIRSVTYAVQGKSQAPVDPDWAMQRFRQLLIAANIRPVVIANPNMTAAAGFVVAVTGETTTVSGASTTTGVPVVAGPELVTGPFTINDNIVVTADTRRQRDRVFEDQLKPVWTNVLGESACSNMLQVFGIVAIFIFTYYFCF